MLKQYILAMGIALVTMGCGLQGQSKVSNYQVIEDREITLKDLESALSIQGIQIHPFEYTADSKHAIEITTRFFRDGVAVNDDSTSYGRIGSIKAGKQRLVLYVEAKDDRINFRLQHDGSSVGSSEGGIELYNTTRTYTLLKAELNSKQPEAVFVYCANQDSISSSNLHEQSIESIITQFEQVVVVYLQIK